MKQKNKIIISASRRTDIPSFYMDWFMERIDKGFFEVSNPYNDKIYIVSASPENVHTIVFWSKNFEYFLKKNFGEKLRKKGFNLFFNFTINSVSNILEPNIIDIKKRVEQLKELSSRFGALSINWRFDPICFYLFKDKIENNLNMFEEIADKASIFGIKRCVTSFIDIYSKIKKRVSKIGGFSFIDINLQEKTDIILQLEKMLDKLNISLFLCCEKEIIKALPMESRVRESACISAEYLTRIFGGDLSLRKDAGQRREAGCLCSVSSDIGSYKTQPCRNNCLYCYANF